MDYIVSAPGHNLLVTSAMSKSDSRRIALETFGVEKLPKGTQIETYSDATLERFWK